MTIIASKNSEIDINDPKNLQKNLSPKSFFSSNQRRKSIKGGFKKSRLKHNNRRKSYRQNKVSNVSEIFKEKEINRDIFENRKKRRKRFKKMKKTRRKTKKINEDRLKKYKEMAKKERRIPFHTFTCVPKFLQVDEDMPFCKIFFLTNP